MKWLFFVGVIDWLLQQVFHNRFNQKIPLLLIFLATLSCLWIQLDFIQYTSMTRNQVTLDVIFILIVDILEDDRFFAGPVLTF